ncbi:unnamed protein product [Didymodactylos carnosus]|uniref:Uncharacterized protein n=1 Tax=Didymodactylos carnosus TaxID=1234261 RepID=A0A814QNC4_9BILA|nr:unnamed protein product [Didymodactylos carnosus]CAF1251092.1 unnamed protein product [Didymodactylos carnosus]CAF3885636.1 unnamed protein product [Didymodactylos carnosus]CAF4058419.1 unnamed protein product [Didymodactylos carnosus]
MQYSSQVERSTMLVPQTVGRFGRVIQSKRKVLIILLSVSLTLTALSFIGSIVPTALKQDSNETRKTATSGLAGPMSASGDQAVRAGAVAIVSIIGLIVLALGSILSIVSIVFMFKLAILLEKQNKPQYQVVQQQQQHAMF